MAIASTALKGGSKIGEVLDSDSDSKLKTADVSALRNLDRPRRRWSSVVRQDAQFSRLLASSCIFPVGLPLLQGALALEGGRALMPFTWRQS